MRCEAGARVYQAIEHPPQDDSPEARLARSRQLLDRWWSFTRRCLRPVWAIWAAYCAVECRTWLPRCRRSRSTPTPALKVVDGRLHHELRFTALQNPLCYPRR